MRRLLPLLLMLPATVPLAAQQAVHEDGRVLFRKQMYGGVIVHGDGWGFNFFHGRHRTYRYVRLLGLEVVSMRHPKEIKSFNPYYEDSRGYFYGKQNALLVVRPTYGGKHQITDKIRRSGVELDFVWGVGPSLGLLKPVYLQIGKPDRFPYETIVTEKYDPAVHNVQNIYGRASWFIGVGEMSLNPGAFGRAGLQFEHAGQTAGIKAIEVGASVDAYPVVVPIMAQEEGVKNKQFFFQLYLSLMFGKKIVSNQ